MLSKQKKGKAKGKRIPKNLRNWWNLRNLKFQMLTHRFIRWIYRGRCSRYIEAMNNLMVVICFNFMQISWARKMMKNLNSGHRSNEFCSSDSNSSGDDSSCTDGTRYLWVCCNRYWKNWSIHVTNTRAIIVQANGGCSSYKSSGPRANERAGRSGLSGCQAIGTIYIRRDRIVRRWPRRQSASECPNSE